MTSAVFDFKDIHMRMRGDQKQKPECVRCGGSGWIAVLMFLGPSRFEVCPFCSNPEGYPSP